MDYIGFRAVKVPIRSVTPRFCLSLQSAQVPQMIEKWIEMLAPLQIQNDEKKNEKQKFPLDYYLTYSQTLGKLSKLESFFSEETDFDWYELVQHTDKILPRLYLLCTVGCVLIKSKEAPAMDILKDLLQMCRGVQHPFHGFFLRNYLSHVSKDKLLEIGSEYEGDANTIVDAVEFLLQNFTEMNKLWVRMQYQDKPDKGSDWEREKWLNERNDLRYLVGMNLHVLSQIDGVDLDVYRETVLPRVLEQIVNCKDELAQYYLMTFIIQTFPEKYHLQTLETLLGVLPLLQPSADIKTVLSGLMVRLSYYAGSSAEVLPEFLQAEAFAKISIAIGKVIEQEDMAVDGLVALYSPLLTLTLKIHQDRLDYVDQILSACVKKLSGRGKPENCKAKGQIVALLSAPFEKYKDIDTVLRLTNYLQMVYLDYGTQREMEYVIIQSIIKNKTCISTSEKAEALFGLVKGLLADSDEKLEIDEEEFQEEQYSVARLIQMLHNEDPKEMLKIICTVKKHTLNGGPKRLPFTVPPQIYLLLQLIQRLSKQDKNEREEEDEVVSYAKLFQILNQIIKTLTGVPVPMLAMRLHLQCAEAADDCGQEFMAYEFFTQAYILYEEEISDSKAQVTALHLIIGTLQRMHIFGVENRRTLTSKAIVYSRTLLKTPDKCRAVYACSHLFWSNDEDNIKDGERVLHCLKYSIRIASAARHTSHACGNDDGSVILLVEIFSKYLYFFEKGVLEITIDSIQALIDLIRTEMQSEKTIKDLTTERFFASTLHYIQCQKDKGGAVGEKYEPIKL